MRHDGAIASKRLPVGSAWPIEHRHATALGQRLSQPQKMMLVWRTMKNHPGAPSSMSQVWT